MWGSDHLEIEFCGKTVVGIPHCGMVGNGQRVWDYREVALWCSKGLDICGFVVCVYPNVFVSVVVGTR